MKRTVVILLLSLAAFSSCSGIFGRRIRGNGKITTESRSTGSFQTLDVSGAIDIFIRQDAAQGIKVEADENLQSYVVIETVGSELRIHSRDGVNLRPSRSIRVYVSSPGLSGISASGACDIASENKMTVTDKVHVGLSGACDAKLDLNAPQVDVSLSGAGTISIKGETRDFKVDGSGSTDIKCFDLLSENTVVDISGAGSAEVFASVKLDVEVSGAADVRYKGNATVSQRVSGAGSVKKVE